MRYQEPVINRLGEASQVIQGSMNKTVPLAPDAPRSGNVATSAAYEADE